MRMRRKSRRRRNSRRGETEGGRERQGTEDEKKGNTGRIIKRMMLKGGWE